ncbi:hypothetical protein [Streptomyces prunicolor]|uniref:Uncharacterized protein n=1 Tax=Streptomyces prunicolor TaxID=67348 RepID=A0ABU4FF13_9ACTN|nr:hypothetical protein [Streptomyces prunicolor]MDV7219159.1 hypothetical protein [Streptomyces prunicolor]
MGQHEIIQYGNAGSQLPTPTRREISRIVATTRVQQAVVHAKTTVGEAALSEISYLKAVQHQLETANPDTAEALALIVNTTVQGIARSVANFAHGLD